MRFNWSLAWTIGGVLLAWTGILAAVVRFMRPHFDKAVIRAAKGNREFGDAVFEVLRSRRAEFKEWNDETYRLTLTELDSTTKLAEQTNAALVILVSESRTHREKVEAALMSMSGITQAIDNFSEVVEKLDATVAQMSKEHQQTLVDMALLKDRAERTTRARRRADG